MPESLPDMSFVLTERSIQITKLYNQCRSLLAQAIKERDEYKARMDNLLNLNATKEDKNE